MILVFPLAAPEELGGEPLSVDAIRLALRLDFDAQIINGRHATPFCAGPALS